MKALSIRQPWASLIVSGIKTIENRSWQTSYHGRLAILAGKKIDRQDVSYAMYKCKRMKLDFPHELPTGGIIGIVDLLGCIQVQHGQVVTGDSSMLPRKIDLAWYEYPSIGWVLANPIPCIFTPYKGKLGLFEISDDLISSILENKSA